jgi:hypothetical protein
MPNHIVQAVLLKLSNTAVGGLKVKQIPRLNALGIRIFGFAVICFGAQGICFFCRLTKVAPGSLWTWQNAFLTFLVAVFFFILGALIEVRSKANLAATLLAGYLFLQILTRDLPGLIAHSRNPDSWTVTFEVLALCGAATIIAATAPQESSHLTMNRFARPAQVVGRIFFAGSLIVFAIQHFLYARFVADLVPGWIPFHLFFAYFVGVAFVASALSILTRYWDRWAALALGTMFALWFVILHVPRAAGSLSNGNEWTSALVALAMCGGSWALLSEEAIGKNDSIKRKEANEPAALYARHS